MPDERALAIWRSIRTTFFLFLVVVPVTVAAAVLDPERSADAGAELLRPALALVVLAAMVAEAGRRIVNLLAGSPICRWSVRP